MLELNRNRPRVLTGFLIGHCYLGKHMPRIGLKQNSDRKFFGVEDESAKHLTSNSPAIREIDAKYLGKGVIDEREIRSLKPSKLLQFINALRVDGEL